MKGQWSERIWPIALLGLLLSLSLWHVTNRPYAATPSSTPVPSPARLAILLSNSSNADLYSLDGISLSLQLIARNIGDAVPAWSPDHKRLAVRQITAQGDIQIALMDTNGLHRHPIYTISHHQFRGLFEPRIRRIIWSPDNMQIAFDIILDEPQQRSYIYIIDTQGKLIKILGPSDLSMFVSRWLANSRDMAYVIHNGTCNGLYVYNLDDAALRFLSGCDLSAEQVIQPPANRPFCSASSGSLSDIVWSADARYLAVTLDTTSPCEQDIILIDSATAHSVLLPYPARTLAWSPDNQSIAYIQDNSTGALCVVGIDGAHKRCSSPIASDVWQLMWLPNQAIAFVSIRQNPQTGTYESQVCLIAADTLTKRCLASSLSGFASLLDGQ